MKSQNKKKKNSQSGQTAVEYILVMAAVITATVGVIKYMKSSEFIYKNITKPMISYLRFNYKYGDPNALGWDEMASGGPRKHIQISKPSTGKTFRLFKPKRAS
jgi:hypothetical protein